jgi:hypothetical protein
MIKLHVFSLYERPQAGLLKELLASEGIHCLLRNDQLSAAIGEIPFIECNPELWLIDEEAFPRARLLLDAWLKYEPPDNLSDWICSSCGEECERQFNACWACRKQRE